MERMNRVNELIESCTVVMSPPSPALGRLLELLDKENHQRSEVESAIRSDAMLASEVLRIANSSKFQGREVSDIGVALMRLGENELFRIVVRASATCMTADEVEGYGMHGGGLWLHGLRSAVAAELLASRCSTVDSGAAYTAGLLLDVGKRILGGELHNRQVEALVASETLSFVDVEHSLFGCDHAEIGAELMTRWKLPTSLSSALRWHHTPKSSTANEALVWVCHVADFLALNLGGGGSIEGFGYALEDGWQDHVAIKEVELATLLPAIQDEVATILTSVAAK